MKGGFHFYRGSGLGAARYFEEGHKGAELAESYYTEGLRAVVQIDTWQAGQQVGTAVLAEAGDLVKWVEGADPLTGEVKGIIRSGGPERQPLRFVEAVINNPKSLSIVASQNPAVAEALDRTLSRQADEVSRYLSQVAVTRIGPRGAQRDVGGLRVETARVTHLTSREGDPHRHVHLMLNTRVMAPDGSWRGLHSAAIRQHIGAVQRVGDRALLTDLDLRRTLAHEGYTLGPDGEIDQARGAVTLLSKRSSQVAERRATLEASWRAEHPDREPSQRVINGWDRAAWEKTRKAKSKEAETPEQLSARIRAELAQAGYDFTPGAHEPVALREITVAEVDRELVVDRAVAALSGKRSAWSRAELTAEVEAAIVHTGVTSEGERLGELVEDCQARALARCQSILDPDRHTPTAMSRHLTSEQVVASDLALNLGFAGLAGRPGSATPGYDLARDRGLGVGQAEAAAAVSGDRHLEVVVGPAGAGKTTMLSVARDRLEAQGRQMVVVAPTRKGAMVAAQEVGAQGSSLSKLLFAHGWRWDDVGRWTRLAPGQTDPSTGQVFEPRSSALDARSVIVVDEAALMTVDQGAALIDLATETGASVRLVGDPRQLGAVGRGGVMETAARWTEDPITLDEVHRFVRVGVDDMGLPATEADREYADLTLAMREGEDPLSVADQMVARGTVVVHGTEDEALRAIAAQVAQAADRPGELATTVATNAEAQAVNEAVRAHRIEAGTVDDRRVAIGMDGQRIGVGDRIVTRRNDPDLGVSNRETWTVQAIRRRAVVAEQDNRRVVLDAQYVRQAVQLGYATTDYGNQGMTANRSVTSVGDATTAGGLYVAATRGRYENTVHLVAADLDEARDQLVAAMGRDRADRGLDAARRRAEREALPIPDHGLVSDRPAIDPATWISAAELERAEREALPVPDHGLVSDRPAIDPATWISAAELERKERQIEALLRNGRLMFSGTRVMDQVEWDRADAEDRQAAAEARQRADVHRQDIGRIEGERPGLLAQAREDYFGAREAARTIEAGPGRFGHRAERVQEAEAARAAVAQRWDEQHLPGSQWPDRTIEYHAADAVDRRLRSLTGGPRSELEREEQTAVAYDQRIATRDRQEQQARLLNASTSGSRHRIEVEARDRREELAQDREGRDRLTQGMTPDEIDRADAARDDYLRNEYPDDISLVARSTLISAWEPPTMEPPTMEIEGPGMDL